MRFPMQIFFNLTFLLVNFISKVLCSFVNEPQLNSNASSREEYTVFNKY